MHQLNAEWSAPVLLKCNYNQLQLTMFSLNILFPNEVLPCLKMVYAFVHPLCNKKISFFATKGCRLWPWLWMPLKNINTVVNYIFCCVLTFELKLPQPRMMLPFPCAGVARVGSHGHVRIYIRSFKVHLCPQ